MESPEEEMQNQADEKSKSKWEISDPRRGPAEAGMGTVNPRRTGMVYVSPGPAPLPSLLGIVYAVITLILLPFIVVFFVFAYLVYRHQIINVYNIKHESGAAFWPHVHTRIIASLLISQLPFLGLLSMKKAANSSPLLVALPVLTLTFHKYCKHRFEPAFRNYPLEEAVGKDIEDRAADPDLNLRTHVAEAYLHPIFRSFEVDEEELVDIRVNRHQIHTSTSATTTTTS